MEHIVFFSGGIGSWATAKRVAEKHGTENLTLLFTDTNMEDEDLYRFIDETSKEIGGKYIRIADGRDVWEVFFDVKFLGNSRIDPCSKILKRDLARRWITKNYKPEECTLYLGIDWTEEHRWIRSKEYWKPYQVDAPLCGPPYRIKSEMINELDQLGIKPPRLYGMGFAHNNCGGFCIKSGQAQFKLLLKTMPERFAYHEEREREIRKFLNKDVSILRKTVKGERFNYTLEQLRKDVEAEQEIDEQDWGGCGCMLEDNEETNKVCQDD